MDTLHLLAQPELTENQMARKSDTKEIKNKHSSRLVGGADGQLGRGGEDSRCRGGIKTVRVWDEQEGSLTTCRPCCPTFAQIGREGRTQSGREWGRQSGG